MNMPKRTVRIEASVTRDYGAEVVTFSAGYVVEIDSDRSMDVQYAWLTDKLYNQHERHTADFLPKVPDSRKPLVPSEPSGEWVVAERIILEVKDKKRYYAVKGGRYSEHGVRIWNETLRAANLLAYMEENDECILEGWEMLVVKAEKGLKVSKLRKAESG